DSRTKDGVWDIFDVRPPGTQRIETRDVGLHADDVVAGVACCHCEQQADIPLSENNDARVASVETLDQGRRGIRSHRGIVRRAVPTKPKQRLCGAGTVPSPTSRPEGTRADRY